MRVNQAVKPIRTHEGATAKRISIEDQLKRSVMACLLFESNFYESGESIAERISSLADQCNPEFVADLAVKARIDYKLRHAPLLLLLSLIKKGKADKVIPKVINRPDEISELVAMYWMDGKRPLSAGMKRGLSAAFNKFDEYQFSKWNRDYAVKLRDVMFLCHPKPKNDDQAMVFKKLANKQLSTPNTWESRLTSGEDKKTVFTDLLNTNKLGYMALLRNLRGMLECGVDVDLIKSRLLETKGVVLPYRFIAAARYAPSLEPTLDKAMMKLLDDQERLKGKTIILVDVSGSMDYKLSDKSDLNRIDAACGLSILLAGICDDLRVFTFSYDIVEVPPRKGMALSDAINRSQSHGGTRLGNAVMAMDKFQYDRLIVITDEQSSDQVPDPKGNAWMINVAAHKNGVGYGAWKHIDGFSESCIDYIRESEKQAY